MRSFLLLLLFAFSLGAEEFCGSGPANDLRLQSLRERRRERIASQAESAPLQRNGAFYVGTDERIAPGRRAFDLNGISLVFEPRAGSKYAVRREALRYVEPSGAPKRAFDAGGGAGWHYLQHDLTAFQFPLFGQQVSRLYLSAFNGIHTAVPAENATWQFDAVEAAVHRTPVLSPLMLTKATPARYFTYPSVYVDETPDALRVTWRTAQTNFFRYDIQAELRKDGTITYSYRDVPNFEWGTPIVSAGYDAWNPSERLLAAHDDAKNDVSASAGNAQAMLDVHRLETYRLNESDLFVVRVKLGAPIDPTKIMEATSLRYQVRIGGEWLELQISRTGQSVVLVNNATGAVASASARYSGDTIEIWGAQRGMTGVQNVRVATLMTNSNRTWDVLSGSIVLDEPARSMATDLSAVANGSELPTPIAEPFVLPALDVYAVWEKIAAHHRLRHDDVDALAIYQSFLTDIIFYAGAYSTGGNPRVDGIAAFDPSTWGTTAPPEAAMLHMNQLTYNYNSVETRAAQVMLHELGHRWLFFARIREEGSITRILNPLSAHPAQYVHLPAAYRVYTDNESSVMGGAYFTQEGDGRWKARVANNGYSWLDLYLMGLASPEEVAPFFYLSGTSPALGGAYSPTDGTVVSGTKRDVALQQLIEVEGARKPTTAFSQKGFRVVFALVTESDREPTAAETAKIDEFRGLLTRNFVLATGGRGGMQTGWTMPVRRRAAGGN
ncbi:MAG TPA: hypothetical protein VGF48_22330 [Thermoanaerobaculia bacterium]|jgi:hypothetical protein